MAVALTGAFASSASAATCDPAAYPTPFLRFYGGIYNAKTRFIELHVRPGQNTGVRSWSDPAYPFTVTVAPSNGAPRSFTVTNYARQQFPAKFTSRTQTTHVTATYDEIHTDYSPLGTAVNTTCSRTISATYKAPPKPPPTRRGNTGVGGRNGGQSEDRNHDE
ncbi:MAG: hypothetical protein QOG34_1285 [Frankiaceae bacterium]|jgi:hypothetical protein|nr:hypothetical protein [Frankiaceae bacterium]